jgi:alanyl-tRNA synthetase
MEKKTKRLYYDDPYRTEFEARIIERASWKDMPALVLDQTCFYPESGGQPSDKGSLNDIPVIDVLENNGKILHVITEKIAEEKVKGKIDWDTRFDHMQQHSGQHILSQSFMELYEGKTLSFHLGEKVSTLEIDLNKVTDEDVERVERLTNEIIFQDREIKSYFVLEGNIETVPLRKPPAKKGLIRVVEVSEYDYSACGGTHAGRTGEIGLLKILKWERIRNNIRFEFVCGSRALLDYSLKNQILRQLSVRFTVGESEVPSSVDRLSSELKALKVKMKKMAALAAQYEAMEIIRSADGKIIKKIFAERTPDELRFLALNIIKKGEFAVLFGLKLQERAHLVLACEEGLSIDMRELVNEISPLIDGKGGGRSSLVELVGNDPDKLKEALDRAFELLTDKISSSE